MHGRKLKVYAIPLTVVYTVYTKQSHVPLLEVLQQIRERIAKGIVSDHWSTVI